MAVDTIYGDSWVGGDWTTVTAAYNAPDGSGASSTAVGTVGTWGLANLPGTGEHDATSVTFGVRANYPSGTDGRDMVLLVELLDGSDNVLSSFTTSAIPKDSTWRDYTSSAVSISHNRAMTDSYRIRVTHQVSGGGMSGTTNIGLDALWATVTYTVLNTNVPIQSLPSAEAFGAPIVEGGDVVVSGSLAAASVGVAYSDSLDRQGGLSPFTWTVTAGSLPSWASLAASTGVITGTPDAVGTANFTLRATDSASNFDELATSIETLELTHSALYDTVSWTGDGGSLPRTITTDVNLSGGGAVLVLPRNTAANEHPVVYMSADGTTVYRKIGSESFSTSPSVVSAAFADGSFQVDTAALNSSGRNYVAYVFRKAPSVCDIVVDNDTSGTADRAVSHNLGAVPAFIGQDGFLNRLKFPAVASNQWVEWGVPLQTLSGCWGTTAHTSSTFRVGTWANRATVWLLFADNAGNPEFLNFGTYTGDGTTGRSDAINVGMRIQTLLIQRNSSSYTTYFFDELVNGTDYAGTDQALIGNDFGGNTRTIFEETLDDVAGTANGVDISNTTNDSSVVYYYMAVGRPAPAQTITGTGIASAEAFGSATLIDPNSGTLFPTAIDGAEAFGTAEVILGTNIHLYTDVVTYTGTGAYPLVIPVEVDLSAGGYVQIIRTTADGSGLPRGYCLSSADGTTVFTGLQSDALETIRNDGNAAMAAGSFTISAADSVHSESNYNAAGIVYVAYVFRKAAGYLDIVSYTGDGTSARNVNHSLGGEVGLITSAGFRYGRFRGMPDDDSIYFRGLDFISTASSSPYDGHPSSTQIHLISQGSNSNLNKDGQPYTLILFADQPAGETQGMVVGTYTENGSTTGPSVNLGWSPKIIAFADGGFIDVARTFNFDGPEVLLTLDSPPTTSTNVITRSSTGFDIVDNTTSVNDTNGQVNYFFAIRDSDPQTEPTLSPTGLASAEAFGSATVVPGAVTVTAGDTASAEAFGSTAVIPGVATVEPTGTTSAEAFGTTTLVTGVVNITVNGIASAEAFGITGVSTGGSAQTLILTGITSAEALGSAAIHQQVAATGIASTEAFGAAAVHQSVVVPAVGSEEAFGSTAVARGTVALVPPSLSSEEAFGALQLHLSLTTSGLTSEEAFGTALLTLYTQPTSISSGEALGTVEVLGPVTSPTSIASAEAFGTPAFVLVITTVGLASAEAFGTTEIVTDAVNLRPGGVASEEAFGSATLSVGGVSVAPGSIASEEAIGAAILAAVVGVSPTGIASAEAVSTPHIASSTTLLLTGVTSGEAVSAPVFVFGGVSLTPSAVPSGELFGTLFIGASDDRTLYLEAIASAEAFGSYDLRIRGPFVSGVITVSTRDTTPTVTTPVSGVGVAVAPVDIGSAKAVSEASGSATYTSGSDSAKAVSEDD